MVISSPSEHSTELAALLHLDELTEALAATAPHTARTICEGLTESVRRPVVRRGTAYGGWWFEPDKSLRNGLVLCAGAGEEVSFGVALAAEYGAEVVIIDPTPRAIAHVDSVMEKIGRTASTIFVAGGSQNPDAYDLSEVRPGHIRLLQYAL